MGMSKSKSGSDRMSLEERLKAFKRRHGIVVSSSAVVNEKVEDVKALERRKQLFMDQTEARRRRSERKSVKSKEIDSKIEHFKQVLSKMKLKREQEEKKQKEDLWKEIEKMSSMVALTLRVDDEEEQREKSKKRKRTKKTNRRLTSSQCRQVEDMFESGSGEDVLVNKYNVAMKRKKLRCLRDGTWLNDEVINFYMKILQEYADTRDEVSQSVHIHNSFFFSKLCREKGGYNYKHVRRWTRKVRLSRKLTRTHTHTHTHITVLDLQKRCRVYTYQSGQHTLGKCCYFYEGESDSILRLISWKWYYRVENTSKISHG